MGAGLCVLPATRKDMNKQGQMLVKQVNGTSLKNAGLSDILTIEKIQKQDRC